MSNPNNCAACDHKGDPQGGWCYMFRDEPMATCAKHTALGVHWIGGKPYMLTSPATMTPEQRARLISGGPNAGRVRR